MLHTGYTGLHGTWRFGSAGWVHLTDAGPTDRGRAAGATDTQRGRVLLFGGRVGPGLVFTDQTWSWQGNTWTLLTPAQSPPGRSNHAMAYDAARDRVVMFGGYVNGLNGSTWTFDGATWTQAATTGPAARESHAMAYDADRQRVVLFGGLTGTVSCNGQTWEWDGAAWSLRSSTGPAPRGGAAMAYDPVRRVTVLFGGAGCGNVYYADTWEWNGTAWTQRATHGPSRRYFHTLSYDTSLGRMILFGGDSPDGGIQDDTWAWDGERWTPIGEPGDRAGHAMTYDRARDAPSCSGGASPAWCGNGTAGCGTA
jgi:hypothetical protein